MSVAPRSDDVQRPRVLITGVTGFTGRYLAPVLAERGFEVHGAVSPSDSGLGAERADLHAIDLLDRGGLATVVQRIRPTHVVHLAAIAFVAHGDVEDIYRTNIVGTRNLLEALESSNARTLDRVLLASSANIYGNAAVEPIAEGTTAAPANDYAVSKLAMEHMAQLWSTRLPIMIVRPFNYTGVGQAKSFLVPKIVEAFRSRAASIELGNLDVERDFSDVRDVVGAYAGLLTASTSDAVFNVCSGRAHALTEVLSMAEEITGHALDVRVNPAFVRANEVHRLRGSNERLRRVIPGWKSRPLRETLSWMLGSTKS